MANNTKSTSVSSSTFFNLKAELSKQKEEFARARASGSSRSSRTEGFKRPDKVRLFARATSNIGCRQPYTFITTSILQNRKFQYGLNKTRASVLEMPGMPNLKLSANPPSRMRELYWRRRQNCIKSCGKARQVDSQRSNMTLSLSMYVLASLLDRVKVWLRFVLCSLLYLQFDQPQSGDEVGYSSDSEEDESATVPERPPEVHSFVHLSPILDGCEKSLSFTL
jgi:hypothetical protein